jgi:hypothetical protein
MWPYKKTVKHSAKIYIATKRFSRQSTNLDRWPIQRKIKVEKSFSVKKFKKTWANKTELDYFNKVNIKVKLIKKIYFLHKIFFECNLQKNHPQKTSFHVFGIHEKKIFLFETRYERKGSLGNPNLQWTNWRIDLRKTIFLLSL